MPCGGVTTLACIGYSECAWDTLCSSDFEMKPHSVRLLVCLGERIEADVQGCGELFAILFDRNDFDVAAVESCSNGRHDFRSKGLKEKKNFYYCVGSFRKSPTLPHGLITPLVGRGRVKIVNSNTRLRNILAEASFELWEKRLFNAQRQFVGKWNSYTGFQDLQLCESRGFGFEIGPHGSIRAHIKIGKSHMVQDHLETPSKEHPLT